VVNVGESAVGDNDFTPLPKPKQGSNSYSLVVRLLLEYEREAMSEPKGATSNFRYAGGTTKNPTDQW